jgi:quercetin 2,3-dioxygenase
MLTQADATIYLASQRGCSQSESYKSYHTFNFRDYFHESRQPIGNLLAVNEDSVTAGKTIAHRVNNNTAILILPVIGSTALPL